MATDGQDVAQPRMLVLARESRSMTQGRLAAVLGELDGSGSKVSQGYVSRAESGRLAVTGDRLDLYAAALNYPRELLMASEREIGAGAGLIHHRKKQALSASALKRVHALLNLSRIQLRALTDGVSRPAGLSVPRITVDGWITAEDAARQVRSEWSAPAGPLDSVVGLLEDAGVLVLARRLVDPIPLDSGSESVPLDAVSCWPAGEDPLVLLNVGTPAERQRFTTAHELGHVVMHEVPHPEQEKQANAFAAELLMPRRDIHDELADGSLSIARMAELKTRWRVSMWALLRRAHSIGVLSDWQYRNLAVEMSSLGYRMNEPGTVPAESPAVIRRIAADRLAAGSDLTAVARSAYLRPDEFLELFVDGAGPLTSAASDALDPPDPREAAR